MTNKINENESLENDKEKISEIKKMLIRNLNKLSETNIEIIMQNIVFFYLNLYQIYIKIK